ncbi:MULTISPECIES: threonine synthase [Halococcus]|uniref:Threonine synthase n=1 Tax=Halococcus salifodinae DSM 8989 TaxID=1227456 RepID=M0MX19_9EURY|nr:MULTISPECIES: threonine synthase [Halococcus]EMA50126.1 threonine synthase [Halococcus salifodinae DSM 8989]
METTAAFDGLECTDCGEQFDAESVTHECPECGGICDPTYDYAEIDLTRAELEDRPFDGQWRYEELLPIPRAAAVTMDEGTTPLIECPDLADELGVGRVVIKDEGRNPTGSFKDRGHALAVSAASEHGASDIVLTSAGNAGQSAAAYAARAGLDSHVFVPSRANFVNKAMINVHGGDMTVVGGRFEDAAAACADAMDDRPEGEEWYSTSSFTTPYRHEGKKTMYYEITEQLDREVPDRIVYPTGGGVGLVGMHKGAKEFRDLGFTDDLPAMYAAQSSGCAPIVDAWNEGDDRHETWDTPDTICGGIEIPDPGASPLILDALDESEGGAVATPDEDILDSAITVAQHEGIEMGATCAAAASGAWDLAEQGEFESDDTVVLMNTATGNKEDDILRSHLMGKGV